MLPFLIGLAAGVLLALRLRWRGVAPRAALAADRPVSWILAALFALAAGVAYQAHRFPWLPTGPLLLLETLFLPGTLGLTGLGIGLAVPLVWQGGADWRWRARAGVAGITLAVAAGYLMSQRRPVADLLTHPVVVDGVVLQTTSYSCTPAAIATLLRALGDSTPTERDVARLTRTTRAGTHTRFALNALESLGVPATFHRGLTVHDLARHAGRAILHVNQPSRRGTDRHAVVLFTVDRRARTVTLGNPLMGRQVKGFDELEGYWYGEAIVVASPTT